MAACAAAAASAVAVDVAAVGGIAAAGAGAGAVAAGATAGAGMTAAVGTMALLGGPVVLAATVAGVCCAGYGWYNSRKAAPAEGCSTPAPAGAAVLAPADATPAASEGPAEGSEVGVTADPSGQGARVAGVEPALAVADVDRSTETEGQPL